MKRSNLAIKKDCTVEFAAGKSASANNVQATIAQRATSGITRKFPIDYAADTM